MLVNNHNSTNSSLIFTSPPFFLPYSAAYEADSGRKEFQEELFEYQYRVPFSSFDRATSTWRDVVSGGKRRGRMKDVAEWAYTHASHLLYGLY